VQRTHHVPWIVPFVVVLLACAVISTPAVAQNLVTNGTFDHDIDGWTTPYPDIVVLSFRSDAGNDLPGGSGPGSMEVKRNSHDGGGIGPSQDVHGIQEGATYIFSGTVLLPDDEDNVVDSADYYFVWFREDGTAVGNGFWAGLRDSRKGEWLTVSKELVAPAGAVAMEIFAMVCNPNQNNETRPGIAYFDDIVLTETSSPMVKQMLFVPAAASAHGRNGTFWTTTGWFANRTNVDVELRAAFLRQGEDNRGALQNMIDLGTVPAGGFLEVEDMVAKAGGAGLTGGLYIQAEAQGSGLPETLVKATTYTFTPNPGASGGYGQGVPARGVTDENEVTVAGVFQNTSYRTNIGVLNTSPSPTTVEVKVFGPDGTGLGTATWNLQPYEQKQKSVTALGVNEANGGYVIFTHSGSTGSFMAYATVVDQETGDAVYTAAE